MRIAIDAHALGTNAGGNETFVRQLLAGLREAAPDLDAVALVQGHLRDGLDTAGFPSCPLLFRRSVLRVPLAIPWALLRTKADLLHAQYIAPPLSPTPFVVTLHDVAWRRFPETFPAGMRRRLDWLIPQTLRRARRVFVVSEAVKRDAVEEYTLDPERIDVVYNSVDPIFAPCMDEAQLGLVRQRYGLPRRYIAYMGQLQPRKNVVRLAQAFARLVKQGYPHSLVFVGKQSWRYGEIGPALEALGLGDRLLTTGYVAQEDLPPILSGADAFAYVSLYEGFGLPVAEAMACGAPVLTSTDPALSEVASDAALTCDPVNVDAIEAGLKRLIDDAELRTKLRTAGPERAAAFSRRAMGKAALAGYRRAVEL